MNCIRMIRPLPKLTKPKRVAAYAIVSADNDAMLHSLSAQISYYQRLIQNHKGWTFAGVYADNAMTGTKPQGRISRSFSHSAVRVTSTLLSQNPFPAFHETLWLF